MSWRLLLVALAVGLAGCSGTIPAGPADDAETVTPVPVPVDATGEGGVSWIDGGRVNGTRLGAAHAASIEGGHTRIVHFHVTGGDGVYLDYRETRVVDASNRSVRTRHYEGPGAARFLPDESEATTVRSERYTSGGTVAERRTVDGRTEWAGGPGVAAPAAPVSDLADAALVAALLENASVVGRTPGGGVRLVADGIDSAVVPEYLEDPRRVTVRTTVGADGYVPHVTVRYGATLEGSKVSVTQDVYWLSRSAPVEPPEWYDREADGEQ